MAQNKEGFLAALDEHHQWPCPYMFKFIVPAGSMAQVNELFPDTKMSTRESKNGKFVSVTFETNMCSATEVWKVYEKAATIPGLMAL